jgi:hypothetical protein
MAKQKVNSQQAIMRAMSTDYPTFQIKSGSVVVTVPAGEPDVTGIVLSTKFPNGVLWGQVSFGAPFNTWSGVVPRGQQVPYNSGNNLCIDVHYANSTSQQFTMHYVVFGY